VTATLDEAITRLRAANQPVPRPLRLPTLDEVSQAESALGVTFHPDYRRYLLETSDVVFDALEPCTVAAGGRYTDLLQVAARARQMGVPDDLLPICEDNDDYYCLNATGEVVYWSHNGTTDERWPNLATWLIRVWLEGG